MSTEVVICGVPFGSPKELDILKQLKKDGVTSIQIYMHWNMFEPNKRGEFDFSYFDRQVALIKKAGLKFVPFILIGPRYSAPKWWLESENHHGLTCLEHNKECPVESIWNERFKVEIDRILKAFSQHYLPMNILESVQPGICGDYGEAIMPAHGYWAGVYHTHRGMWCGGDDAVRDFRNYMRNKFTNIDILNKSWRSNYTSFDELKPFLRHKSPSRTAWFDLIEWYRGAMTSYVDFWMRTTRKYFPDTTIYMCTGGLESPTDASFFSEQAKISAKYNGGIRLTNEMNDFFENFFATAYTHSACEQYGTYFGLEPVGTMTKEGIGSRIFSSSVYGNRQIFFYYGNIYDEDNTDTDRAEIFRKYISLVKENNSPKQTAVLWPTYVGIDDGGIPNSLRDTATFLRKITDFAFTNENMINDGFLDNIKLLIIPCEITSNAQTCEKIQKWVQNGGILFSSGRVYDLEKDEIPEFDNLLGLTPESDFAEGRVWYHIQPKIPFKTFEKIGKYFSEFGYTKIAQDATVLSVVPAKDYKNGYNMCSENVYNAFYRRHGKGTVISYFGPIDEKGPFCPLLQDVALKYGEDLRPGDNEVVRGKIGDKLYSLYPNGDIYEL